MKNPNFSASTSATPDEKYSEEKKRKTDVAASFKASENKPFVMTPEIYRNLKDLYQLGILPIIVLHHHGERNRIQEAVKDVPLCGAVFLMREESSLKRISASDLKAVGFELSKTLEETIEANWCYFYKQKHKELSSYHDSIPCITMNMINDNCFEFSAPEAKWIALGSPAMVDAICNGSEPLFATKYISFSRVVFSALKFVKSVGNTTKHVPLVLFLFLAYEHVNVLLKAVCYGVEILLLYVGMSRLSSPFAYRLTGAAVICSLVLSSWSALHDAPLSYGSN